MHELHPFTDVTLFEHFIWILSLLSTNIYVFFSNKWLCDRHAKPCMLSLFSCVPLFVTLFMGLPGKTTGVVGDRYQFSSVQFSCSVRLLATPWTVARQASLSITNSEFTQTHVHRVGDPIQPSHPSVIPFSSCPQSLPASESFLMSQLFAGGGQSAGVSALVSFLPKKSQGWSPSE